MGRDLGVSVCVCVCEGERRGARTRVHRTGWRMEKHRTVEWSKERATAAVVGPWEDRRCTAALASSPGYTYLRRQRWGRAHGAYQTSPSKRNGNGREAEDGRVRETHGTSLFQYVYLQRARASKRLAGASACFPTVPPHRRLKRNWCSVQHSLRMIRTSQRSNQQAFLGCMISKPPPNHDNDEPCAFRWDVEPKKYQPTRETTS